MFLAGDLEVGDTRAVGRHGLMLRDNQSACVEKSRELLERRRGATSHGSKRECGRRQKVGDVQKVIVRLVGVDLMCVHLAELGHAGQRVAVPSPSR